jgi:hypothetical protein
MRRVPATGQVPQEAISVRFHADLRVQVMLLALVMLAPAVGLGVAAAPALLRDAGEPWEAVVGPVEQVPGLVARAANGQLLGTGGSGGVGAQVAPGFGIYPSPNFLPFANGAGETSIGVNPTTGAVMFQMYVTTAHVDFNDAVSPPTAAWTDVSYFGNQLISLDPVLHMDPETGRTIVTQLAGPCSTGAYTDTDGIGIGLGSVSTAWIPMALPCAYPSFDHPTVGSGNYSPPLFNPPLPANPVFPNAVYYCAQQGIVFGNGGGIGFCSRSDDGGLTWGASLPMNILTCGPFHGRAMVGPDGTVYLPFKNCPHINGVDRVQGVIVSSDNGITWNGLFPSRRTNLIPAGLSDPSLAFDASGRMWFAGGGHLFSGTTDIGSRMYVSTSPDRGLTWTAPVDVGASAGIENAEFAMMMAGDAGKAAVAFYGTTTGGNDQATTFAGIWHVYVAVTLDNGATWTLTDVTGSDPVQRGSICLGGINCPAAHRNLLDFQGAVRDITGRIVIGYADGCITATCIGPSGTPADSQDSYGTIARQYTGTRLCASACSPP